MNRIKHYIALVLLLFCSIVSSAHDFEVDGMCYNLLSTTDRTVLFAGYASADQRDYLEIPEVVTARGIEFSVVGIADNSNISVKTAIIPEHIRRIGTYSFSTVGTLRFNSIITSLPDNFCNKADNVVVPGNIINFGRMSLGKVKYLSFESSPNSIRFQYTIPPVGLITIGQIANVDTLILNRKYSPDIFGGENYGSTFFVTFGHLFGYNIKKLSYGDKEGNGNTILDKNRLRGLQYLEHLIIRPSVEKIEKPQACDCISLRELTIEDADAPLSMSYCEHSGYVGNSYRPILNNIFHGNKLVTVYIGRNLKIPTYNNTIAAYYTYHLTSPFQDATFDQTIKKVTLRDNITVPSYLFEDCPLLEEVTIPNGLNIGSYAFGYCKNLKKVTLPKNFTLHHEVFSHCVNLEILNFDCKFEDVYFNGDPFLGCSKLKNELEYLKLEADKLKLYKSFQNYSNLKAVEILSSNVSIGDQTFSDNKNLQRISMSGNVQNIGDNAFSGCSNLTQIICDMPSPPTCSEETFGGVNKWNVTLFVPKNSIPLYSESVGWKEFLFIEAIETWDDVEVNNFKEKYVTILTKNIEDVVSFDLGIINKALDDYNMLSDAAKAKLTNGEKALLDALKTKAEELKAAEDADAAAPAEANKFKTDNAAILGKTTETVKSSDIPAINVALDDYNMLSEAAKAKLTNGEKSLLDALKTKAEEIKAAEEADAAATAEAIKFWTDNERILSQGMNNAWASSLPAINAALDDYYKLSDAAKAMLGYEKEYLDVCKIYAEIDKFDTDNATILGKTTATVVSSDIPAINTALDDYSKLSEATKAQFTKRKTLLDALKTKAEEIKAAEEADASATAEANKFKADNATILGKTTATVASSDIPAINTAMDDYSKLSEAAKAKLTNGEKSLLDALKTKAEELKAAEEADAAATTEANKFKTDNATILGKTTATVVSSDIPAINTALDDYSKLSEAAKAKLTNGEKALLDALKTKAEEIRAAEETEAAATEAANKFKVDNAEILGKTTETVKSSDIPEINKALKDYTDLSETSKAKLVDGEKALLDALKVKAEELKEAEEKDAAATAEAEKFMLDNAVVLDKTPDDVASSDLEAVEKALEDYDNLSDAAKDKLKNGEKSLLESLKSKAEELKAAEEADQKATEDANDFKYENKDILDKSINDITLDDLDAIEKALEAYEELPDNVKEKLNDEKADLDKKKQKVDEITSVISSVDTIKDSSMYYRLNGLRINSNAKGFIIKDGKKMFVK